MYECVWMYVLPGFLHTGRTPRRQPCCAPTFLWPKVHTHTHKSERYYKFIESNAIDISSRDE